MTTGPLRARVLAAGALGCATLGGLGVFAALHLAGSPATPVLNITNAATGQSVADTSTAPKSDAAADQPGKPDCGGGPRDRAPLDDATAAKVKDAALKAVPGATVDKSGHDRADGYVALLTKSDGTTRVLVHEDKDFKVTNVQDPAPARGGRHERGDAPGPGAPGQGTGFEQGVVQS